MENARQFNQSIGKSALLIEKVHSCTNCPMRQMAIKQPESIFAKIHAWHKTWWPGWKAHRARTCSFAAMAGAHSQTNPDL
jgi:hypothetical protein